MTDPILTPRCSPNGPGASGQYDPSTAPNVAPAPAPPTVANKLYEKVPAVKLGTSIVFPAQTPDSRPGYLMAGSSSAHLSMAFFLKDKVG